MRKMKFLKGMGAGLVVGACIGMTVASGKKSRRFLCRAMKAVESTMDDLGDIIGF